MCSHFPRMARQTELGEIAISLERAALQAGEFGHTTLDEVRILLLHGVLHLTGLDHDNDRRPHGARRKTLARRVRSAGNIDRAR